MATTIVCQTPSTGLPTDPEQRAPLPHTGKRNCRCAVGFGCGREGGHVGSANVDAVALNETLRIARAAEHLGRLAPGDWPNLSVALLLEDVEDSEVAELAGFDQRVSAWTVHPLTEALYERHQVSAPDTESAVDAVARLLPADLRARPATVTAPMIRLLARLAPPSFESSLASQCYGAEEYLDCDCTGQVDPSLEDRLEAMPGPRIPDRVVRVLAAPLRSTLPLVQPPHSH